MDSARAPHACLAALLAAGCAGEPLVTRVEHGRVDVAPAIAPGAYAANLRESVEHARPEPTQRVGRCAPPVTTWAVDDALARGDLGLARRHAACARMHDAELSLRAWYFGHAAFSAAMIEARLAAEPSWNGRTLFVGAARLLRPRSQLGDVLIAWALALRGHERAAAKIMGSITAGAEDRVLMGLVRAASDTTHAEK